MYLIEEEKQNINVYTLGMDYKRIEEYKKEQMKKIKENERILGAYTNYEQVLDGKHELIYSRDVNFNESCYTGGSVYHVLSPYEMTEELSKSHEQILENYYQSKDTHTMCKVMGSITDGKVIPNKYLFPLTKYLESAYYYYIENILNVPYELYQLEYFLKGNLEKIEENLLMEFRNFYLLNGPIKSFDKHLLSDLAKFELALNENQIGEKIAKSTKYLELVRKKS